MSEFHWGHALLLFLALFALYSPIAALSSYLPYMEGYTPKEQLKLSFGLFCNVTILMLLALWVGEPLLELLGISTAALSVTGGIALILAAVPMMTGSGSSPPVPNGTKAARGPNAPWRSIVFTPLTFPLTFGGTTFGFFVAYRADVAGWKAGTAMTVAGFAYAAVTGITLYLSGHLVRRVSASTAAILDRVAGILLTAIAVTLIASGGTRLVDDVLNAL
ncbi:MarC family protein [Kitasatospora sp. NPDC101801]|uniref:MarC family protein n=1 Tax=Kitasatospora sp. NPDC101801 TaxID=3364103 RepID=UPI00380F51D5